MGSRCLLARSFRIASHTSGASAPSFARLRAAADRLARLNEASLHLVEASGGDPAAVGSRILAGRLTEMLEALGAEESVPLAKALATLRTAEAAAARVELEKRRADHADEALALEKEKFRWQAAGAALKLFEDRRAADIAAGPGTNEEKIRALLRYMDEQEAAP